MAESPLLAALAEREGMVRSGNLDTIIFIRNCSTRGQEFSGYIDFAQRLKSDKWESYLSQ